MLFVTRSRKFHYLDAINEARFIFKKHGLFNFWRGNSAFCFRVFPFAAINFSVFDFMRRNIYHPLDPSRKKLRLLALYACGGVSGACSTIVCYPFDVLWISLAMQRDNFQYKNIFNAVPLILKNEGVIGFYRGISVALSGVVIYHGGGFFVATSIKEYFLDNQEVISKKWYVDFLSGSTGALVGQFLGYPFDITRKRYQAQRILFKEKEIKKLNKIFTLVK